MKARTLLLLMAAYCLLTGCGIFAAAQNRSTAQAYAAPPVDVTAEGATLNGKTYYSHLVVEKQTLYSISKSYGVSIEEIEALNPTLKEKGLQAGRRILIPIRQVKETQQEAQPQQPAQQPQTAYTEHKVKWYEDLNGIAAQYGVSATDIMTFNGLASSRLRPRMILKIPKGPVTGSAAPETGKENGTETTKQQTDTTQPAIDSSRFLYRKDYAQLALLLPFNTKGKTSTANMDFYAGVLLALHDREAEGTGTQISVYDISGSGSMPDRSAFEHCDAVLGPVSAQDLTTALGVGGGSPFFISPLDQGALHLAEDNRNFIQAPTPVRAQYEELARWVADDRRHEDRILVVSQKGGRDSLQVEWMDEALSRQYFQYNSLEYTLQEGRTINQRMASLLDPKVENRILLVSENETFTSDVIRNLTMLMTKGYPITLYAPSKVRTFDIDGNSLHQVRLHIASPYFVDYDDERVQHFVLRYRALYNTEPSQFAFQGYDLAHFFVGLIGRHGSGWARRIEQPRVRGLHTDLRFQEMPGGAYVNTAVRRIIYRDDYTTTLEQ